MKPSAEHAHSLAPVGRVFYLYLLLHHNRPICVHIFDHLVHYMLRWAVDSWIEPSFLNVVGYLLLKVDTKHLVLRTTLK